MNDLCNFFDEHFRADYDVSGPLLEQVQRLRFQVYCLETRFEDAAKFTDGREKDRYDERSTHCLIVHKPTGIDVGTVRLILPKKEDPLPVLANFRPCFTDLFRIPGISQSSTAEPSRLLLTRQFRRRASEFLTPSATGPEVNADRRSGTDRRRQGPTADRSLPEQRNPQAYRRARAQGRRVIPHVFLVLVRATLEMSVLHRIEDWVAAMEPSLLRQLAAIGMDFTPVGAPRLYGGRLRQPCHIHLPTMLRELEAARPNVCAMLTDRGRLHRGVLSYAVDRHRKTNIEPRRELVPGC